MEKETFIQKINNRSWGEIRHKLNGIAYLLTFKSYWHYLLNKSKINQKNTTSFFAARPNIYAGIGHQMANWIAGLWFAKQFGLKFASIPFSTDKWDTFLGFGNGETQYYDLIKQGYKVRRLPEYNEKKQEELEFIRRIISTYAGSKTILLAIQDQGYTEQYGVMADLKYKFRNAPARKDDNIEYDKRKFNIAVHVRRTVVIENKIIEEDEAAKAKRWLSNDYYEKVLKQVLDNIKTNKPIAIWLFSTGKPEEFAEFKKYGEVHFCSHMDEYRSFAHLIFADLLITSKSSFSYKPALMSDGIKVCPRNFWHGYPNAKDWILCENDGTFDVKKLKEALG
ncbi:MAG TPA: hypothetical protein DCQ50_03175 [Chryseobacterium sp.]|nr:hypothetical protein [Chryseobacterium sp.]